MPNVKKLKKPETSARHYQPADLIDSEASLLAGLAALQALDPERIAAIVEVSGVPPLRRREAGFAGLVWIIVSQQVSVASANAIAARVHAAFEPLNPQMILEASEADLRSCGLSAPKMRTLRALSAELDSGALDLAALAQVSPEEAHAALVRVKGIGPWTADIFLLFCLGHPDAWPAGDLALQEALRLALGLDKRPDARHMETLAEKWRPYRAVMARLLWAFYKVRKTRSGMAPTLEENFQGSALV